MGRELPSDWDSRRKKVYKRDDYECQNCGRKGGPRGSTELHAHHNVPRHSGGTHKLSNLTTYCSDCHDAIHYDSHDAPTAVDSSEKLSVKERVMKHIESPNTACWRCMESWEEGDDYHTQDTFDFLEYDARPREFLMSSEGKRQGSIQAPYHIRCANCGTLYGRQSDSSIAEVEFEDDISSNWYKGIIASLAVMGFVFLTTILFGYIQTNYQSGFLNGVVDVTGPFVFPLGLLSYIFLPISIYNDIRYLRANRDMNPNLRYWTWFSLLPGWGFVTGLLYLYIIRR